MACTAHLLLLFMVSLPFCETVGYFPGLFDLAKGSPIRSSSTCGKTSTKYCDPSTLGATTCTKKDCLFACCPTCTNSAPTSHNLENSRSTPVEIFNGEPRPGKTANSLGFDSLKDSKIEVGRLPNIDHKKRGFTISVWVNQTSGNTGTIFSKSSVATSEVIYGIVLADFTVTLYYIPEGSNQTENIDVIPLASQYPRYPNGWHFIALMVYDKELSYFLDGQYIGTKETLKNSINDASGHVIIGQSYTGEKKYDGLMQDIFLYPKALTNREVIEKYTGTFPSTYIAPECRCPPSHPKISTRLPAECAKNYDENESDLISRLSDTSHPIEFATDSDIVSYWLSNISDQVTINVDLLYQPLQVFHVISLFYGPQPQAILIERSYDHGHTYHPWQYFASDCVQSFGMANNGVIKNPDSVNCLQYEKPYKFTAATVTFRPDNPGQENVPLRPYGPNCNNLYCSPKLLDFIRATNIRIHFYNHTLVKEREGKYFGLDRLLVSGRCECYGHAKVAKYIPRNATENGSCVCECNSSTHTEGIQCNRCKPLYNNKAFHRSALVNSSPCVKCECNEHTNSCYYNRTLDRFPKDRTKGGGGVCNDCLHNTAGQHCEVCQERFYRETGKRLDNPNVCTPCGCSGAGVKPGAQDCAKDNSDPLVSPGQCECKDNVTGHLCDKCKPGFYDLTSSYVSGCISCDCDTRGTNDSDVTCDVTTGQCNCKSNVIGRQCEQCKAMFYNLSSGNHHGCQPCLCNMTGATSLQCDKDSGQCPCRSTVSGRQCERCEFGFHTLDNSGCQACQCSPIGTRLGALKRCDPVSGKCQCKNYVSGYNCDRCISGYYNLRRDNVNGCTRCRCDSKGTLGNNKDCHALTGGCACKSNVTGASCDQCPVGYFNLSSSNQNGCQPCQCYSKGTKFGDTKKPEELDCQMTSGQCLCLSNVNGEKCDQCAVSYVWNHNAQGCIPCDCDPDGSISPHSCNDTGFCDCKTGSGVGGQFCSSCLTGYHSFTRGRCSPCNCNKAGIKKDGCDAVGCLHCKENVEGKYCNRCKPGTNYLKQENSFGCSGVPSQQGPPIVQKVNSRTLWIAWDPPDQPNGLITNYILYRNGSRVYNGLLRAFNDTGLRPYTLYTYYIITHTDGGSVRSLADGQVYRTPQDHPAGVARPNLTDVHPRTAKAFWSNPVTPNGIIRNFSLVSTNNKEPNATVHCHGLFLKCSVTQLKPYTLYNFSIEACTDAGCTLSEASTILTRSTAPDSQPAPVVTPVPGGRRFFLYWDEPAEPNGVIFRYELYQRNYPFQPGDRGSSVFWSSPSVNLGKANGRNTTITGLVPFSHYQFRVETFTADVNGVTSSNWTTQRTAEAAPEGENTIRPQSYAVSSSEVNISWSLPSTPYGIIIRSNIYIYTNETFYLIPNLTHTVNGGSSGVVSGLQPYSLYQFTVTSCNSVGCTKHSSRTQTRTLASAPTGQDAPIGRPLNSTHIYLSWNQPAQPNGPIPPVYHVLRSHAAFHYPPINVIDGAHFPGFSYYRLSNTVVPAGTQTNIEFYFKTRFSNGLLVFLASSGTQEDFLAVELRDGVPWFIFDCQTGVAEITLVNSMKFNDERWHHLKISRNRKIGNILVDDIHSGMGSSQGSATVIDENTGVYVGGVSSQFEPEARIKNSVPSLNNRIHFIGCLKDLRLQNKMVSFRDARDKVNVDPLSSGCPLSVDRGIYLKGGGYFSLSKGILKSGRIYNLSYDFRTYYLSGLLMFIYDLNPDSYLAVVLDHDDIQVFYRTPCCYGNFTVSPPTTVCDGHWHTIELTSFGSASFVVVIDGKIAAGNAIKDLQVSSELFFGGVPPSSVASEKLEKIGIKMASLFGGCFKNIVISQTKIDLLTDVVSVRNADLSGCPKNRTSLNFTVDTCRNLSSTLAYSGRDETTLDKNLAPFTDYLYRVESKQPGSNGGGKSAWFVVKSGEGAPEYQKPPHDVTALDDGRSIFLSWLPPLIYNGVLRGYVVSAYRVRNSSTAPVQKTINNVVDVLNTTLRGLDPYTLYDVRVGAFTNGGKGESPGAMVNTLESVPEDVPSPDVQRQPYSLFISWQRPLKPNGIITNYSLSFDGVLFPQGLNLTFNITKLRVYTRYSLRLTACTSKGCANSDTITVYTAEIAPQNVTAPDVVILDAHSADVQWERPGIENGVIRGYQVLVNKRNADVVVFNASKDQFTLTVMNLTAGTWYHFRINAINGGGATRSTPTMKRTVESSPEQIPAPDVRGLSPFSILVTIQEPRLPNGVIIRYELFEVVGLKETLILNGSLRNYTKTGLLPYTPHSFRSKACTAKGCGSSRIGTGHTLETPPNGTVSLNVSILNSISALATWTIVHTPNGNVSYNLLVNGTFLTNESFSLETEITSRVVTSVIHPQDNILVTLLLPYTLFKFQINASNTAGFVLSNVVDGMTKEGAPMGLTAPNVTILNSTSAYVTWMAPARDNGVLLYYELMRVNLETNISKINNNSLDLFIVITDLEPYTRYQFQVAASTRGGRSLGPQTEVTTFEDIPSPIDPPKITKVDSRSLLVIWNYPTTPNGVITRYLIYRNNTHKTKLSSNVTMLTVENLEPFTIYTFSVGVCTMIGCSNSSVSRPVRTLEDVPEGQSSPALSHAPGPSVLIRWSAPTVTNGKISEYQIQRRSQLDFSNISLVASVAGNLSTEYRDSTVKPCSKYYYRVIAFTKRGGTPSPWSNITTQEGAPDVVPSPTTRTVNSSAVHVTWSKASSQCNVTEYIIRVRENSRNYTGFRQSAPRSFTVGNLLPYKRYSFVVAACTSTACRDSAPSVATTDTSLPRDQPPPSATPLDSRSLRVTWSPPMVPAGRIVEYRVYRRTLQEPVSENFTTPSYYVLIYQGIRETFDDKGMMSIFSLQQYKVMVINTDGNTTSNDSLPYRTGPAPPLAGVLLSGRPINHTNILLNWTLPQLNLLRGSVISYEVYYTDLLKNVEYTYMSDLEGKVKSVIVSSLKPSRDYSMKVVLDNGAGTFQSNDVRVRTLDGAPEGFDKPIVRTIDTTTIEVTWIPPRIPNGRITTYIVYVNGTQMGNTSGLDFNVTSLIPFTIYAIQVEVCTVYTCVRSDPNSAKTLPAVPEQLHSPRLFPGPRNMMVIWGPPRRPNGVMLEYKLFRRRLEVCPTSPPPITYCTYIECLLAEELCGSTCYNPKTKICCNAVLYNKDPTKTCCDTKYITKTSPNHVCCSGRFYSKLPNHICCYGYYKLVKPGQVCCMNSRGNSLQVGDGNACCDGTPYVNTTKYCVCDTLYNDPSRHCCGGNVISRAQICCGGTESDGRAYDQDLGKNCCGSDYVPVSSLCCKSKLRNWKVYNYSSITERDASGEQCCEENKITAGLTCCNDRGYNASVQVCADKTGCGTGTVCNKSSATTPMCDQCDFNHRTLFCGFTLGYYTAVTSTPPPNDCGGDIKEIASGNGRFLRYDDQDVIPYTTYEYYVIARNTEGNVSSSTARNTTLMDAPEGLSPPDIDVLSARSIEIRFSPPREPNGLVKEYKVTRVNENTRTLVYRGLNLSYVDSGLEPVTPYIYILEACTRVCSNVSSRNVVYTSEAKPENVNPPSLKPLNSSSIEIRWQRPGKPNGIITEYRIKRINSSNDTVADWLGSSSTMMLVDAGLRPYTNYTYTVTACTNIGCSTSSRGLVTTLEAAPEGLEPPVLIARSARSVEVSWVEPGTPNGIITRYTLYRGDQLIYNGTEGCQKSKDSKVVCRHQDRGLTPHTWYNYSVEASTNGGSTRSNISRTQTPESSPEGIPVPTLKAQSSSSILVSWTKPSTPNGNIDNYTVIVDTLDERRAGRAMQLTVTDLTPYTSYSFQIKACTIKGCGVGNRTNARTLEAPPEDQPEPTLVARSDAVVRITWRPPKVPNGVISSYEVERKLQSSVPIIVFKTTRSNGLRLETLNSGLLPYRNYSYRIYAINGGGGTRGPWAIVRTLEGAPSGLPAPVVHVLNATAVMASWQQPLETNGHITGYELWSRELDNPRNKIRVASSRMPEQNVTVDGLKPNTNYEFQLAARTIGGVGYSQWALAETMEAPPLGIRSLSARKHANGRELTLTWEEPSQPNGAITDYIVYSEGVKVFSGISRECHLGRLQPYTSYTFQLEACTSGGCTKGLPEVITTAEIPPRRQQAPIFVTINSTLVTIQWRPPALPYGEIILYQVLRLDKQSAVHETNETNKTIFTYMDALLQPFIKYEYKVRAINSAGSTVSPTAVVTTDQAPPAFVNAPVLTPVGSSSVTASWTSPERTNGIVISYTLRRNNTVVGQWSSTFSFVDTFLNPATLYGYWLTVCTGGGCTDSAKTMVKTGESRPGVVNAPNLTVLSSLAIRAEWQPPVITNGLVTNYHLYIDRKKIYSGNKLSYVVSSLSPFTTYTFDVSACTTSGCTSGDSSSATTHEAKPENLDRPTYSVLGPSVLEIKWTPPRNPNGIIKSYLLTRNNTVIYNGTDHRFNDVTILPYSYYKYVVTAVNSAGHTDSPELYTNRTSPGTPENVSAPDLAPLRTGTEIRVSWVAPARPNGKITKYFVLYNKHQVDVGVNMSYIATHLDYYTQYGFRIRACTSSPPCADSIERTTRTLEGPPRGQRAPVVPQNEIEARSVVVVWIPPLSPHGVILRYLLHRRKVVKEGEGNTGEVVYNGLSLNVTDTNVIPFQMYEYRVVCVNSKGEAQSEWTKVTTSSAPPENVPTPRVLRVTDSSIIIVINPPGKSNGVITDYKVELNGKNVSSGTTTERTIGNLEPYFIYSMRVFACTLAGCTPSKAVTQRTETGAPGEVEALTFKEVTSTSIHVAWKPPVQPNGEVIRYFVVYKFVCSENCIKKRAASENTVDVGLNTSYVITNLQPYTTYEIVIRVENTKQSTDSQPVTKRTATSDPEYVRRPVANVTDDVIFVDWSKTFRLNGPLVEYILYENEAMIFHGTRTSSGDLPNRGEAEFIYVVSATTTVNGEKKTIKSVPLSINISGVSSQISGQNDPWYQTIWFLVLISVLIILAVFAVVALCLRRTSGDRTVYLRTRDPLPVRPKSRSGPLSLSSNYTPSEAQFNLGMTEFNRDTNSQASTFIGEPDKFKKFEESSQWEGYTPNNESNGNTAWPDDDRTWTDEDEPDAVRSMKYQVFTDTHL